jgi:hypothetical protein
MGYTSYEQLNNLGETSFIAGTEYTFTYNYFTDSSLLNPANLTDYTAEFRMALCGQTGVLALTKNMTINLPNEVTVTLESDDTATFSGKYMQQPIILNTVTTQYYILGQGTIIIQPQIVGA